MTNEYILEMIADIYEDHKISQFGFNLIELAKKMGIIIITYDSFPEEKIPLLTHFDEDGFSWFNPENETAEIYYNSNIKPIGRLKYTIPHEIYHIEDGHIFKMKATSEMERDAAEFSRQFYLPQALMLEYKINSVHQVMSLCGVTHTYASTLINKLEQRIKFYGTTLSPTERRIVNSFKKNREILLNN